MLPREQRGSLSSGRFNCGTLPAPHASQRQGRQSSFEFLSKEGRLVDDFHLLLRLAISGHIPLAKTGPHVQCAKPSRLRAGVTARFAPTAPRGTHCPNELATVAYCAKYEACRERRYGQGVVFLLVPCFSFM